MSSLASLIATDGPLRIGLKGQDVLALQLALTQAGYRVASDSDFGPRTKMVVQSFQLQHGLSGDGVVGKLTAQMLDAPHEELIASARPFVGPSGYPHDDTASLLAFYGRPWEDASLLTSVPVPFAMSYRDDNGKIYHIESIRFHEKAAAGLVLALAKIAEVAKEDQSVIARITHFSGSYNYRPVRGSSRLSCHAFGAAIDFDAEDLSLGKTGITASDMPQAVVDAFDAANFFWGNRYTGRKDPMHFQAAHE